MQVRLSMSRELDERIRKRFGFVFELVIVEINRKYFFWVHRIKPE